MRHALRIATLLALTCAPALAQESLLNDLTASRSTYPPVMTRAQAAQLLNDVAARHPGWGLLKKGSGNSCPRTDGVYVSCDILIYSADGTNGVHFDVMMGADFDADAGASNMKPQWISDGPCVIGPSSGCAMSNFLMPVGGSPAPTSPGTVTGGGAPTTDYQTQVLTFITAAAGSMDVMQAKLDAITNALLTTASRLDALENSLKTGLPLPTVKFPAYSGNLTLYGAKVPVSLKPVQ